MPKLSLTRAAIGALVLLRLSLVTMPAADGPFSDSLLPGEGRPAGSPLAGTGMTEGGIKWTANKGVILNEKGATATTAAGAHHAIPVVGGTIKIEADLKDDGSGFTGIALGRGDLSGNFWANLSMVFYVSNGTYNLMVGTANVIPKADKTLLKADGTNHLELQLNTVTRTMSAKVNGTLVLEGTPVPATARLAEITAAGFRFNEPVKAGSPLVSNFRTEIVSTATTGLEPADLTAFFVTPDQESTLRWHVKSSGPSAAVPYELADYSERKTGEGSARLANGELTVVAKFPAGYHEIRFPDAGQTFGIVAIASQAGPTDPFFGLDSGLSWCPDIPIERRVEMIRLLARSGVAIARERLGLGNVRNGDGGLNWEGKGGRQFEAIRKAYAENHLPILEILNGNTKLPELAADWVKVAQHWPIWGGAEASNEPDQQPIPADQYLLEVRTYSYALAQAQSPIPLVSGAFSMIPPSPFFDTCAANGLLEDTNAISFHSYDRAPDVEGMVGRYRAWLKKSGKEAMPLWHTECGWAWTQGPDRPPQAEDAISACEISAKAVESKACGLARYFPFVYFYYIEGRKNFGMTGREHTPLRMMAAYVACTQALSGTRYIGDLTNLDPSVKRARVFAAPTGGECVAVLYTGKVDSEAKVALPVKIKRATGADGRSLEVRDQTVAIPDGLAYVWMDLSEAQTKIKSDTAAAKLYEIGQHPLEQKRRASPLVLQYLTAQTPSRPSTRRYLLARTVAQNLPVNVRISNLSPAPIAFTPELILPGKAPEKSTPVTVPPMGFIDVAWKVDATACLDIAQTRFITVTGEAKEVAQPLPLAIPFAMEGSLEEHLKRQASQKALPIAELPRWKANIAANGKSSFSATLDGGWRLEVKFTSPGDSWTYPRFTLPEDLGAEKYSGFLLRARLLHGGFNIHMNVSAGANSPRFWAQDLFPADGEWHVVYVPFGEFKPGPGTGDQNNRINPAAWKDLEIGMATKGPENAMEISHLLLVGGSGD